MIDWSDYANFSEAEFRCHCGCGRADMDPDFMNHLQRVRDAYGRPMSITSGYRCPKHDRAIGGAGVHPMGRAADTAASGKNVYHLLKIALTMGMRGIGLKQHGDYEGRFMHLDDLDGPMRPRIWTYT